MTAVPWTLCCVAFTGLYWTYPRDKALVCGCAKIALVVSLAGSDVCMINPL